MPRIDHYSFGRIVIDGREHTRDVIVLPDRVVANWWRRDGHSLVIDDLDEVLHELPDRLLVGCGAHGRLKPDPSALQELHSRGVTVELHDTAAAVKRYSELDPRRTAAALHLTC